MKNVEQDTYHSLHLQDKNYILDIDGVLWAGNTPADGSIRAVESIQRKGSSVCLLSNDAISSRSSRLSELNEAGFKFPLSNIFTASYLAAEYIRLLGSPKSMVLGGGEGLSEFADIPLTLDNPEIVVVTDYFDYYNREALEAAFRALLKGAKLIAAQKNRSWMCFGEEKIDVGFWVSGLEYCCRQSAILVGKPSAFSYETCLTYLGTAPTDAVMISDDASSDLRGAKELGLSTVHISNTYDGFVLKPEPNVDAGCSSLADFAGGLDSRH